MKYEKSCGAIIFTELNNKIKYLVVKHNEEYGGHWDFPKGHVEAGETEIETACREIYEEVGLKVDFIKGYRKKIHYFPKKFIFKTVVYFLANTRAMNVSYILPELTDHKWLTIEQAVERLTFKSQKKLVKEANKWLLMRKIKKTTKKRI